MDTDAIQCPSLPPPPKMVFEGHEYTSQALESLVIFYCSTRGLTETGELCLKDLRFSEGQAGIGSRLFIKSSHRGMGGRGGSQIRIVIWEESLKGWSTASTTHPTPLRGRQRSSFLPSCLTLVCTISLNKAGSAEDAGNTSNEWEVDWSSSSVASFREGAADSGWKAPRGLLLPASCNPILASNAPQCPSQPHRCFLKRQLMINLHFLV